MQLARRDARFELDVALVLAANHVPGGLRKQARGALPVGPCASPAVLQIAAEHGGSSQAGLPHRQKRVVLGAVQQDVCTRLGDGDDEASELRRGCHVHAEHDGRAGAHTRSEGALDDRRAGRQDGLLSKDRRQSRGILHNVETTAAAA